MARVKYLSLKEARKADQLDQFAKEHPVEDVHPQARSRFKRLLEAAANWRCEWRCPVTGPHRSTVTNSANYRV